MNPFFHLKAVARRKSWLRLCPLALPCKLAPSISWFPTCPTAGRLEWTSSPWLQKSWAALWLEGFIHMVCSLVKSVALRNNQQDPFSTTSQFFHLLAISLQQINASLWLNRQPHLPLQWTVSFDYYSCVCLCLCFLSVVSLPIFTIKFYHPHHHHYSSTYQVEIIHTSIFILQTQQKEIMQ